jgi:uncharacterized protein YecE (DUF72 family)
MSEILIGTSGYFYKDWKGEFYPVGTAEKDYLRYYSLRFKALELNFSYYRIPGKDQSARMVESSEGRLRFVVKANRLMTHEISDNSIKEALPLFLEGISPFIERGLLGTILLQFPQSFHYTTKNRHYLKSLIDALYPFPVSVEFRQKEWLKDSVYESLQKLGAGFVCVDEPSLPSLIPPVTINTSPFGYLRFHGRNKKNWYGSDSRARYDYLYSENELKEWLPKIMRLAKRTEKVFVFFNNHAKAQAVTNARMLINLLDNA